MLAIDFRNAPEAPTRPRCRTSTTASAGSKRMAANSAAAQSGSAPTARRSGGHQVLLAAMRPDDSRYRALPLSEAPEVDAKLAFVISGWGRALPARSLQARHGAGQARPGEEPRHILCRRGHADRGTPALAIERGEKVHLPPALVFQGTKDEWTPVELAERLAADYRRAGGSLDLLLVEGERHTFVNEHPFAPNSVKTMQTVQAFIKKHGLGQQLTR